MLIYLVISLTKHFNRSVCISALLECQILFVCIGDPEGPDNTDFLNTAFDLLSEFSTGDDNSERNSRLKQVRSM